MKQSQGGPDYVGRDAVAPAEHTTNPCLAY